MAKKKKLCVCLCGTTEDHKHIRHICRKLGKVKKAKSTNPDGLSLVVRLKKHTKLGKIIKFLQAQPWVIEARRLSKKKKTPR